MKHMILGMSLAGCASAASAATWGDFAWGAGTWGASAIPVPVNSPLALLGLTAALASAAIWYLKKRR
ncbi:MAG: LPXTG cell wall anchor domain-containing protein [Haliea sp.]